MEGRIKSVTAHAHLPASLRNSTNLLEAQATPNTNRSRIVCKNKVKYRRLVAQKRDQADERFCHHLANTLTAVRRSCKEASITYLHIIGGRLHMV